ncbi:unnamed protein product [Somion occarium]|uniref:Tetraspanin Tsp2 n=1 Tax=Somion occarium TaxID=3059160 RepID=A0ABP1E480_9APHY
MEPNGPPQASLADSSSIRRCSGALSPNPGSLARRASGTSSLRSAAHAFNRKSLEGADSTSFKIYIEDIDQEDSKPSVLLVCPKANSPNLLDGGYSPSLPFQGEDVSKTFYSYLLDRPSTTPAISLTIGGDRTISPISLTPQPSYVDRGTPSASLQTVRTSDSPIPLLPTSGFLGRRPSVRSLLSRLFSLRRGLLPQDALHTSNSHVPRSPSGPSTWSSSNTEKFSSLISSTRSNFSTNTTNTIEYPRLQSSLSTSDKFTHKFTHKFPIHRSVKKLSTLGRGSQGGPAFAATLLGEGEGLGIETVDRWTSHKWCLLLSVCTVFTYGMAGLICAVLTWFKTWEHADIMLVTDYNILTLLTIYSAILLLTSLVGTTGTILNSRPILAIYALLLWPALFSILVIGYASYKRYAFSLDRKLNFAWSQWYSPLDRLIIQNALHCCGFYSPLHEVTPSNRCYVRTSLPGCKAKLYAFERMTLRTIWFAAFSLVPVHIANILVALLCANQVTRTFGKGITPKQYRLSGEDVKADAEKLMEIFRDAGTLGRPRIARASSSCIFREDREEAASPAEYNAARRRECSKNG